MYRYITKLNTLILQPTTQSKYAVILQHMATITDGKLSIYILRLWEVIFIILDTITKLKQQNKGNTGRPLYLDAQATTPLVCYVKFTMLFCDFEGMSFFLGSESFRCNVTIFNIILWKSAF